MNDWSRTWFAGEESLQTVKDIVPGVIGLRGNSREQDNSKRRPQAKARQKASVKTHSYNPSSVFCPTLSKRTNLVSQKLEFLGLSGARLFAEQDARNDRAGRSRCHGRLVLLGQVGRYPGRRRAVLRST